MLEPHYEKNHRGRLTAEGEVMTLTYYLYFFLIITCYTVSFYDLLSLYVLGHIIIASFFIRIHKSQTCS